MLVKIHSSRAVLQTADVVRGEACQVERNERHAVPAADRRDRSVVVKVKVKVVKLIRSQLIDVIKLAARCN